MTTYQDHAQAAGFRVGTALSRATAMARAHASLVMRYVALVAVLLLTADALSTMLPGSRSFDLPAQIAAIFASGSFATELLRREGLVPADHPQRPGAWLGASLLSGLGIVLGLVLLVVPGLILAARWFVAPVIAVTEQEGARQSLRSSSEVTAGARMPILGLQALFWLMVVAALALVGGLAMAFAPGALDDGSHLFSSPAASVFVVANNVIGATAQIFDAVLMAASYSLLTTARPALREVFA